ncbi:MAG: DoxX family membrane protein [Phycisphaeraceae bacterium]|nr:DoxX family membrane protein [Phycisphaeraceae bacterium]
MTTSDTNPACSSTILKGWTCLVVPIRLAMGVIFALAAYTKLRPAPPGAMLSGPQDFSNAIKAFQTGLPDSLIQLSVFAVPWTEALCAVLLILGLWTRAAGAVASAMLILFTGLVISALSRGLNISCGCFGEHGLICSGPIGPCKIAENGLLIAAALAIALTPRPRLAIDSLFARS